MFGLLDRDISEMTNAFASHASIEKVILQGSRAKGNYKNGSDVDLTILGKNLSEDMISDLNAFLNEETNMPYYVDVVNYNTLTNKELINHIDRVGKVIYSREKQIIKKRSDTAFVLNFFHLHFGPGPVSYTHLDCRILVLM